MARRSQKMSVRESLAEPLKATAYIPAAGRNASANCWSWSD
ncbi:hypothetical protein [Streptomyces sp. R08]|uniref:Uncharacterized protein n=1 Tax=Streptomyces sp. R08 TaxID=3238624 RepID=A0AB39M8T9_9ACTN